MLTPRQKASIDQAVESLRQRETHLASTCYANASALENVLTALCHAGFPGVLPHKITGRHLRDFNGFALTRAQAGGITEKGEWIGTDQFRRHWQALGRTLRMIGRGHVIPPLDWTRSSLSMQPTRPSRRARTTLEDLIAGLDGATWHSLQEWFDRPRHGSRLHPALLHAVRGLELLLRMATNLRPEIDMVIGAKHVRVIVAVNRVSIDELCTTPQAVNSANLIQRIASDLGISKLGWPTSKSGEQMPDIACRRELRDSVD